MIRIDQVVLDLDFCVLRQAGLAVDDNDLSRFDSMVDDSQSGNRAARLYRARFNSIAGFHDVHERSILTLCECLRRNDHGIGLFGKSEHRVDEKSRPEAIL